MLKAIFFSNLAMNASELRIHIRASPIRFSNQFPKNVSTAKKVNSKKFEFDSSSLSLNSKQKHKQTNKKKKN